MIGIASKMQKDDGDRFGLVHAVEVDYLSLVQLFVS